jgi:hypothetical protein
VPFTVAESSTALALLRQFTVFWPGHGPKSCDVPVAAAPLSLNVWVPVMVPAAGVGDTKSAAAGRARTATVVAATVRRRRILRKFMSP